MEENTCQYTTLRKRGNKTIYLNCRACSHGRSSLYDEHCRKNILSLLQKEQGAHRIILHHTLVKIYQAEPFLFLQELSNFIENLESHTHLITPNQKLKECPRCQQTSQQHLNNLHSIAAHDPITALHTIKQIHSQKNKKTRKTCDTCEHNLQHIMQTLLAQAEHLHIHLHNNKDTTIDQFLTTHLQPYVRPGFIDTYIQLEPPQDAILLQAYDIQRKGGRPLHVTHYLLRSRPEKLYFAVPSEYELPAQELNLLEHVREELAQHQPQDSTFMDTTTIQEYFRTLGKKKIRHLIQQQHLNLTSDRINYLADVFARYTAGYGILEDLLLDEHIQDIYVNAPVEQNPLHIVLDGEEFTSNIYLSEEDIDALTSRFRTISGRAFSEATPVLDMELEQYHTRVAAISNPLTPRGIAFALRRHRHQPWTLTHFIANHMLSSQAAGFLSFLVDGQASLLIAGSRGAGKTSLLSSLVFEIPPRFRILTIEDTPEIPVDHLQHLGYKIQSLITKTISSSDSSVEVHPTDALRTALRLGESVLIIGEVRGVEAKVLFEAMRIGAAGNLIMGTIHGSTHRDVYERVVYDIGVPATSFKAVDAVVMTAPIRREGGIERKRRVTSISEVVKAYGSENTDSEKVFQEIMRYDVKKDVLTTSALLDQGQSHVLLSIAKKWGISVEKALQNISLRAQIKQTIVDHSKHNLQLLEAPVNRDANNAFWMFIEESKMKHGAVDYGFVKQRWMKWFKQYVSREP